jgi:uncharacterized protein
VTDQEKLLAQMDWDAIEIDLNAQGWAKIDNLLSARQCDEVAANYEQPVLFRSRVVMARHGFGRGEYQYFAYPLPDLVAALRNNLYPFLAKIANLWQRQMGKDNQFASSHSDYIKLCHEAGQTRPTPLLLKYGPGDYNCLHQDLYGDYVFPLQLAVLLSRPGEEFSGGEFVMTEQRPRMQSRVSVVPLKRGDGVIFTVNERPVQGTRGTYRVKMRHGVSKLIVGARYTLGVIFHDAK